MIERRRIESQNGVAVVENRYKPHVAATEDRDQPRAYCHALEIDQRGTARATDGYIVVKVDHYLRSSETGNGDHYHGQQTVLADAKVWGKVAAKGKTPKQVDLTSYDGVPEGSMPVTGVGSCKLGIDGVLQKGREGARVRVCLNVKLLARLAKALGADLLELHLSDDPQAYVGASAIQAPPKVVRDMNAHGVVCPVKVD